MGRRAGMKQTITGTFQGSGRGFGFVIPEGEEAARGDFFIPPSRTGGAWDGDRVTVVPKGDPARLADRRTGDVASILARKHKTVIGTVCKVGRELWLKPDRERLNVAIKLLGKAHGVRPGEKIAVEMQSYGSAKLPPLGAVREQFGRSGSREAGVEAILYQYEIDPEFPPNVLAEAEQTPGEVAAGAAAGRLDLRDKLLITIDGAASKDLDDAISLERDGEGNWRLGVHIADVSHYVPEKSALDREAWERGTSVYFADRVVPMLPVALSNGICSLNPNVDRLALSCFMTINKEGEQVAHSLHKSLIRSAARMTYEDCNLLLDEREECRTEERSLSETYGLVVPMLKDMAALARKLEWRRRLRGSLDLDTSESYILCDEQGLPVEVRTRKQGVSEGLIESFMLAANETVAQHLFERGKPAIYRVHEKPSVDKTEGLKTMLEPFGYPLQEADSVTLQKILDDVRDKPEASIVGTIVLRSLMKARYDVQNLGHFGLAAPYYCHFTSPIRRYPDLMVHRILTKVLADGSDEGAAPWEKKLALLAQKAAVQSSERELAAQSAEREIEKLYFAEFMQGHIGEMFPGAASGVTKYGIFVLLVSGIEGFLPVAALPNDHYQHDEKRMTLRGEHGGETFSFGMGLNVVCTAADPGTGQIEFRLEGYAAEVDSPRVRVDVKRQPRYGKAEKQPLHANGKRRKKK